MYELLVAILGKYVAGSSWSPGIDEELTEQEAKNPSRSVAYLVNTCFLYKRMTDTMISIPKYKA